MENLNFLQLGWLRNEAFLLFSPLNFPVSGVECRTELICRAIKTQDNFKPSARWRTLLAPSSAGKGKRIRAHRIPTGKEALSRYFILKRIMEMLI